MVQMLYFSVELHHYVPTPALPYAFSSCRKVKRLRQKTAGLFENKEDVGGTAVPKRFCSY